MEREADSNISSQRTMNKYDNRYVHAKLLQLCPTIGTLWIVGHQVPLSMLLSRQEYWHGLPFLPPGDLPTHRSNLNLSLLHLLHCKQILYH